MISWKHDKWFRLLIKLWMFSLSFCSALQPFLQVYWVGIPREVWSGNWKMTRASGWSKSLVEILKSNCRRLWVNVIFFFQICTDSPQRHELKVERPLRSRFVLQWPVIKFPENILRRIPLIWRCACVCVYECVMCMNMSVFLHIHKCRADCGHCTSMKVV